MDDINLASPIEAFNGTSQATIELYTRRDGRTAANLPRVGRRIVVGAGSEDVGESVVTAADVALLCEEARRTMAAGMALLEAGLEALSDLDSA